MDNELRRHLSITYRSLLKHERVCVQDSLAYRMWCVVGIVVRDRINTFVRSAVTRQMKNQLLK